MTEAERVLAELAKRVHLATDAINFAELRTILEPYLPKPEPDRLTVAAIACIDAIDDVEGDDTLETIRAIIAREVAAAEPSDALRIAMMQTQIMLEAIERTGATDFAEVRRQIRANRAALKGEGA